MSTIIFDIETSPDAREIYKRLPSIGSWPGRTMKTQNHNIISIAYKQLGSKQTRVLSGWDLNEDWHVNDQPLVSEMWHILQDATEVVTHNGIKFDWKAINMKLLKHDMPPLPKIKHVDTCTVARHTLSFYSNKLDDIADYLGVGQKISWTNKWDLWYKIAFGEAAIKDLKLMERYNIQDVDLLEQVYLKLRPYIGNKCLNKNVIKDANNPICHTCGSDNLKKWGMAPSGQGMYQRMLCLDCNTWNKLYKNKKKTGVL